MREHCRQVVVSHQNYHLSLTVSTRQDVIAGNNSSLCRSIVFVVIVKQKVKVKVMVGTLDVLVFVLLHLMV